MTVSVQNIEELKKKILRVRDVLSIEEKKKKCAELIAALEVPGVWDDQDHARYLGQERARLEREVKEWDDLSGDVDSLAELVSETPVDHSGEMEKTFEDVLRRYEAMEFRAFFSGPHDRNNAIISLHAGTGGVDAMDWNEMLTRMYVRFCESMGWRTRVVDEQRGGEAGIKSISMEVVGEYAYGYLKAEHGVHRLVRISPFDAEGLRQTSFALLEVVPELRESPDVDIKPDEIRIDVYRASGKGGQGVNTTDSAVRITHLPTDIVVTCQNERSQLQNKETAMKMLRGKLQRLAEAEREEEKKQLRGAHTPGAWGNQIRSYVLNPYRMVKDHRTQHETSDVQSVLDGNLLPFIEAFLKSRKK